MPTSRLSSRRPFTRRAACAQIAYQNTSKIEQDNVIIYLTPSSQLSPVADAAEIGNYALTSSLSCESRSRSIRR